MDGRLVFPVSNACIGRSEIKRSRRLQREEVCGFFMKYDFSLSVQRLLFAFLQEGKGLFQAFVCHEEMLHE